MHHTNMVASVRAHITLIWSRQYEYVSLQYGRVSTSTHYSNMAASVRVRITLIWSHQYVHAIVYSKYQDYGFKSVSSFPHMCDVLPGSTHTCAATNTSIIESIIGAAAPILWGRPKAAPIIILQHMDDLSLATHQACVS